MTDQKGRNGAKPIGARRETPTSLMAFRMRFKLDLQLHFNLGEKVSVDGELCMNL